jgi:hypothetical protein
MTINATTDILILAIPILLIGFIIGTGVWRKFTRNFWFFVLGCAAGALTLLAFEINFSAETIMILASISLNRFFNGIMGRDPNMVTINLRSPVCIFGLIVIALIVIASAIDWSPRKRP